MGATLPCIERLKEPSLSEANESAPHCKMTAPGLYQSIIACMTYFTHEEETSISKGQAEGKRAKRKKKEHTGLKTLP